MDLSPDFRPIDLDDFFELGEVGEIPSVVGTVGGKDYVVCSMVSNRARLA